jgi:hypothetical protein
VNKNGIQDDGPLSGIKGDLVVLADKKGSRITDVFTDNNGAYKFCDLEPGKTYKVQFGRVAGYERTQANIGNDLDDSDIDDSYEVMITMPGYDRFDIDAGFFKKEVKKSAGTSGSRVSKFKKIYRCKDSRALNFSHTGQHKASLCVYPKKGVKIGEINDKNKFEQNKIKKEEKKTGDD